jgi:Fis family transcriptional regulator, factor for inversion stimulation protein
MNTSLTDNESVEKSATAMLCTPLSVHVQQTVAHYLEQLNGHDVVGLHAMVMAEVEKPLLQAALEYSGYNQSKTAKALGLSRSTLRKKMDFYGLT